MDGAGGKLRRWMGSAGRKAWRSFCMCAGTPPAPSGPPPLSGEALGRVCGAWKGSPERGAVAVRRLRGYSPPHLHVVYAMKADAIVRGADMDTRQSRLQQGFHLLGRLLLCESNLVYNPQKQGGVVDDGGALGKKLGALF